MTAERPIGNELIPTVWIISCPNNRCGYTAVLEKWDVAGACEGMVICPECCELVNIESGRTMEACGDCEWCKTND